MKTCLLVLCSFMIGAMAQAEPYQLEAWFVKGPVVSANVKPVFQAGISPDAEKILKDPSNTVEAMPLVYGGKEAGKPSVFYKISEVSQETGAVLSSELSVQEVEDNGILKVSIKLSRAGKGGTASGKGILSVRINTTLREGQYFTIPAGEEKSDSNGYVFRVVKKTKDTAGSLP